MAQTAIVVLVHEAESLIGGHRSRHTDDGAHGMGAHVTLLYPFGDGDAEIAAARDVVGAFEAFDFALASPGRFPETPRVLCLRPEPDEPFRALTRALAARFPEHPPYSGKYADPVPHATVAIGNDALLDEIERELAPSLPIASRATEAVLMDRDGCGTWRVRERLPLR
jgi:2'-5' RNA ligase